MWLYLYGCQAVRRKLKKEVKNAFFMFLPFFWAYVRQPDNHIGWATSMPFASIYSTYPKTNPRNFSKITLRIGGAGKWHFLVFWFLVIWFFKKEKRNPNETQLGFHMSYHLFLHSGWFLLNHGKDFIRTNMHTTAAALISDESSPLSWWRKISSLTMSSILLWTNKTDEFNLIDLYPWAHF